MSDSSASFADLATTIAAADLARRAVGERVFASLRLIDPELAARAVKVLGSEARAASYLSGRCNLTKGKGCYAVLAEGGRDLIFTWLGQIESVEWGNIA